MSKMKRRRMKPSSKSLSPKLKAVKSALLEAKHYRDSWNAEAQEHYCLKAAKAAKALPRNIKAKVAPAFARICEWDL
jgi:hypothetical protein